MDFLEYRAKIARLQSPRWSSRQKRLNALSRVLSGKQYDHIKHPFSQEKDGDPTNGKRILLDDRRPAAQAHFPKELVRDQCGLIFGEDHRPIVIAKTDKKPKATDSDGDAKPAGQDPTTEWIAAFIHDTKFWHVLMDALWKGSVGSSVIVLRILGDSTEVEDVDEETNEVTGTHREPNGPGHYYFEVWPGEECAPIFKRSAPEDLESLDRRYFIGEDALRAQGYDVDALKKKWDEKGTRRKRGPLQTDEWAVRITLDAINETWYLPVPRYEYERQDWKDDKWQVDEGRSFPHEIGEVPAQWVRPLPINADEYFPDGACIFEDVIDFEYRVNRTISQVGRAFDYSGDPQLARMKGDKGGLGASTFGQDVALGGTASDIIETEAGGDAKFVEISGQGLEIAIEAYVAAMRDLAKSAGAMSRVTPNSSTGAMPELSSVAMKILNYAQLILAGILRETAAERPGDRMLRLAMRLSKEVDVELPSLEHDVEPDPKARFEFQWPDYYEPHGQEKLFEVQAINAAEEAGNISHETAVANTAPMFDVQSTDDEIVKIDNDQAKSQEQEVAHTAAMAKAQAVADPPTGQSGATPK